MSVLIRFEGSQGSGKTLLLNRITKFLADENLAVSYHDPRVDEHAVTVLNLNMEKLATPQKSVVRSAKALQDECYGRALKNGWWEDKDGNRVTRPVPELLCLIHSEISEALEGFRKDLMDDHLPNRKMLEVELADAVIRIFDMAGGYGLDVAGAIAEKLDYNDKRADHKRENRFAEGGKKI